MLNINLEHIGSILLGSVILPFAELFRGDRISRALRPIASNGPGMNSQLSLPVSPQGTAYFVNHPEEYRPQKLCL